jgi:hypothetical protein
MQHKIMICLWLITTGGYAQTNIADYSNAYYHLNRNGAISLVMWGGINVVMGGTQINVAEGTQRFFHEMNIYAGSAILSAATIWWWTNRDAKLYNSTAAQYKQAQIQRNLVLTTIAGTTSLFLGIVMWQQGDRALRQRGYGASLMMHSGFLLLVDTLLLIGHFGNGKKLTSGVVLHNAMTPVFTLSLKI